MLDTNEAASPCPCQLLVLSAAVKGSLYRERRWEGAVVNPAGARILGVPIAIAPQTYEDLNQTRA